MQTTFALSDQRFQNQYINPATARHWTHSPGSREGWMGDFFPKEVGVAKGTWPEMLQQDAFASDPRQPTGTLEEPEDSIR